MSVEESVGIEGLDNPVTQFSTGAVRDVQENKGRCDLIPLCILGDLISYYNEHYKDFEEFSVSEAKQFIFYSIGDYVYYGDINNLLAAVSMFICRCTTWKDISSMSRVYEASLDVSLHYKHGLQKYGERNWEKGIPLHSYIDSSIRHLLKVLAYYNDERHDLAFIWNLLCCAHTDLYINKPELRDLPFCKGFETLKDATTAEINTNNSQDWEMQYD